MCCNDLLSVQTTITTSLELGFKKLFRIFVHIPKTQFITTWIKVSRYVLVVTLSLTFLMILDNGIS